MTGVQTCALPIFLLPDEDQDGIYNERDERDMVFTWIANHVTTRNNVFSIDGTAQLSAPPYYQKGSNNQPLPFKTYRCRNEYSHKKLLGVLDRSTCLRIRSDGTCDFTGPIDVRLMRLSDDVRVW